MYRSRLQRFAWFQHRRRNGRFVRRTREVLRLKAEAVGLAVVLTGRADERRRRSLLGYPIQVKTSCLVPYNRRTNLGAGFDPSEKSEGAA